MKPAAVLTSLRERGFEVSEAGGKLRVVGPQPRDLERSMELLRQHRDDLLRLLRIEADARQHRAVVDTLNIFPGSRLVAVVADGERWPA